MIACDGGGGGWAVHASSLGAAAFQPVRWLREEGCWHAGSAPLEALAVEWGSKVARYSPFTETLLRPNPKVRNTLPPLSTAPRSRVSGTSRLNTVQTGGFHCVPVASIECHACDEPDGG